jgi:hypothetical protein
MATATATATVTVNPSEFCNRFREALVADLRLSSRTCPRCVLNYPDCDVPDTCYWEDNGASELTLHCVYDFEVVRTIGANNRLALHSNGMESNEGRVEEREQMLKEARDLWLTDVLKECYRVGGVDLYMKWLGIFGIDPLDPAYFPLPSVYRCRSNYEDYDDTEEAKLLALLDHHGYVQTPTGDLQRKN